MNNARRKTISKLLDTIAEFRNKAAAIFETQIEIGSESASIAGWLELFETDIEDIKSEEQEYIDNLPENLQSSDKASQAESSVSALDDAGSSISEVKDKFEEDMFSELDDVIASLETAKE